MIMILPPFSNSTRMIIVVIISNGVKTNIRGNDSNDIVIMIAVTMALTMMMVVVVVVVMSFSKMLSSIHRIIPTSWSDGAYPIAFGNCSNGELVPGE